MDKTYFQDLQFCVTTRGCGRRGMLEKWAVSSSIRAYTDDVTTMTTTQACTKHLLDKLQGNIKWTRKRSNLANPAVFLLSGHKDTKQGE